MVKKSEYKYQKLRKSLIRQRGSAGMFYGRGPFTEYRNMVILQNNLDAANNFQERDNVFRDALSMHEANVGYAVEQPAPAPAAREYPSFLNTAEKREAFQSGRSRQTRQAPVLSSERVPFSNLEKKRETVRDIKAAKEAPAKPKRKVMIKKGRYITPKPKKNNNDEAGPAEETGLGAAKPKKVIKRKGKAPVRDDFDSSDEEEDNAPKETPKQRKRKLLKIKVGGARKLLKQLKEEGKNTKRVEKEIRILLEQIELLK